MRCGLCCAGVLFADVEISGAEAARLEFAGLETEDDELLLQPCRALRGRRCSMYAHRPKCCRTFECALLKRAKCGELSLPRAAQEIDATLRLVQRMRKLLAAMPKTSAQQSLKERCIEAIELSEQNSQTSAELEAAMNSLDAMINEVFLQNANSA